MHCTALHCTVKRMEWRCCVGFGMRNTLERVRKLSQLIISIVELEPEGNGLCYNELLMLCSASDER